MPITYDEDGLHIQTQEEIRDEIFDELDAAFGVPMHRNPAEDPLAQVVEVLAESEALTQQALAALARARDPDGAIGRPLDAAVGLTGTTRKGKTYSYVDGLLTFTAGATVPNGARYLHVATNTIWAVTDGPHTSGGAGTIAAQVTAIDAGPLEAAAASSWTPLTVIAGVTGFSNPSESATVGRSKETDPTLQRRRKRELYAQGQGPLRAIEGAVSQVDGVITVRADHNPDTYPTDSDGIPFKATYVVVETSPSTPTSTQQQAIWDAIWEATGGGGWAYGTDYVGTVTDSEGRPQQVAFDTVDILDIEIEIDLITSTTESSVSPQIDEVVAAAVLVLAQAEHQLVGRDVLAADYVGEVMRLQRAGTISGVDAVDVRLSVSPSSPTTVAKLSVGIAERAAFDAARITVVEA